MAKSFPFRIVAVSPRPISLSSNLINLSIRFISWFYLNIYFLTFIDFLNFTLTILAWFHDIILGETFQKTRSFYVHSFYIYIEAEFSTRQTMLITILQEICLTCLSFSKISRPWSIYVYSNSVNTTQRKCSRLEWSDTPRKMRELISSLHAASNDKFFIQEFSTFE